MYDMRPLTSRLYARLLKRRLTQEAVEVRTIAPAAERASKTLLCLPDDPERIRGHHPDSSPEVNLARLRGEPIRQRESRAYRLRDVVIADGTVMTRRARAAITDQPRRKLLPTAPVRLSEATLCSNYVTERYFGHWLRDGLSHELWAHDQGSQPLVLSTPPARVHEPGYRALTGLQAEHVAHAHVDSLWYLSDHELSDDRVERVGRVRARIRAAVPLDGPSHVFLSRGRTGKGRVLANEEELQAALVRRGFGLLTPETSTPAEIARTLASARVVVSPEGSAKAHAALAMPEGGTLVVLQPPMHFNMVYKTLADALDIRFAFTVGEVVERESFSQPVDRLERLLDLVERSA